MLPYLSSSTYLGFNDGAYAKKSTVKLNDIHVYFSLDIFFYVDVLAAYHVHIQHDVTKKEYINDTPLWQREYYVFHLNYKTILI